MTEEFKKRILAYLCGKLEIEAGDNTPQYSNVYSNINNLYTELANEVGEDATQYGEFISTYFAWVPLPDQKEKAEEMSKMTKKNKKT